ncbi:hypothetical protein QBZ16_004756 [Prototheca wickerhamii]|uniref:Squalene monooxygenase n=1 Tax=Prototheca wickerhamii TaxID=3111 RepID=A0AAD9IJ34_PROWI|nr:hypothetical protein QBZ16_004756 [Prototheca wickerhamii]
MIYHVFVTCLIDRVWDLIVVGAGVAGAAFAYQQGQQGRRVLLLERDLAQPDRFVGELLQPGGVLALRRLGLGHAVEGIDAQAVYGYALFKEGRAAELCYPDPADFGTLVAAGAAEQGEHRGAEADRTSTPGVAFHNGRFVQRLRGGGQELRQRDGAARHGDLAGGGRRRGLGRGPRGARGGRALPRGGRGARRLCAPDRRLRRHVLGAARQAGRGRPAHAFFLSWPSSCTTWRCPTRRTGTACWPTRRQCSSTPSPAARCAAWWITRATAACPRWPTATWRGTFWRPWRPRCPPPSCARPLSMRFPDGRVRSMANKQLTCAPAHIPGAILLGDSFNMRHPLTGGGMTVALSDAALLCDLFPADLTSADAAAVADATAEFYLRRKPWAATINTLANALYRVFCAAPGDAAHEAMRRACYDYLASGGERARGPMSLISGVNPRPRDARAPLFLRRALCRRRAALPAPDPARALDRGRAPLRRLLHPAAHPGQGGLSRRLCAQPRAQATRLAGPAPRRRKPHLRLLRARSVEGGLMGCRDC